MPAPVAEVPPWPLLCTPPAELTAWLDQLSRQYQHDPAARRHLLTLRWLVLAELDRTAPDPPPKSDLPHG